MTGILRTGALTATTQVVAIGALNDLPMSITLNSTAAGRQIRVSNSRSAAANTFYAPDVDMDPVGSITVAILAPIKWVEFTGNIGDTYEAN